MQSSVNLKHNYNYCSITTGALWQAMPVGGHILQMHGVKDV